MNGINITGGLSDWLDAHELPEEKMQVLKSQIVTAILTYIKVFNKYQTPNALMQYIYGSIDEQLTKMPPEIKKGIQCKKGCSFCCRVNVSITKPEAAIIANFCRTNKIPIQKAYLQEQLKYPSNEIALSPVSQCVFLKNGECSIYPVRPNYCRKYLVASDPKYCDNLNIRSSNNKPIKYMDMDLEIFISALLNLTNGDGRMPEMLLPYAQ